jgi:hypothetical protein
MSWASKFVRPEDRVDVGEGQGRYAYVQFGGDLWLSGDPGVLVEKLSEALTECQAQLDGKADDAV